MEKVIYKAVVEAIDQVGLAAFKRTSLFLSNERVVVDSKKAA